MTRAGAWRSRSHPGASWQRSRAAARPTPRRRGPWATSSRFVEPSSPDLPGNEQPSTTSQRHRPPLGGGQVVSADEGAIEAKWHERCGGSAYFAAAGLVLVQTFGELGALAGCGELLWAGHFLALLSLGGHTLDELKFSIDGPSSLSTWSSSRRTRATTTLTGCAMRRSCARTTSSTCTTRR